MTAFRLVLFDDVNREQFLPLAWTRPLADFRIGIFTIREKWEKRLRSESTTWTAEHLAGQWPFSPDASKQQLWINSRIVPTTELAFEIASLAPNQALIKGELLVAVNNGNSTAPIPLHDKDHLDGNFSVRETTISSIILHRINDIFTHNGKAIREDFELLEKNSNTLSSTNTVIGTHPVYVGENVIAEACIFNTTKGPIYIGDGAELMEGCLVRGPLAIGDGATLKMGAKIYGDTTIGPGCKIGGEVSNCVIFGNTNKAHDGFLGNSVLGEWCNLGADTNCSNLKNNYGDISVWNYVLGGFENTVLQFHGIIMGDHSKAGINTMFNTGTVIGVASNVFGGGFPQKFIPDFAWGGAEGWTEHSFDKTLVMIRRVYARRHRELGTVEIALLKAVFQKSESWRRQHFNA